MAVRGVQEPHGWGFGSRRALGHCDGRGRLGCHKTTSWLGMLKFRKLQTCPKFGLQMDILGFQHVTTSFFLKFRTPTPKPNPTPISARRSWTKWQTPWRPESIAYFVDISWSSLRRCFFMFFRLKMVVGQWERIAMPLGTHFWYGILSDATKVMFPPWV